jgi:CubicO group peptidase (beta-lactamase class C family)
MRTHRLFALLLILILLTTASFAQSAPADLDAWVQRAMKTFEVPGIAVAIVKDGKVVVAKGYGVRELGKPDPVDANTLFGIASNTKAFTAAALGILVDEKKLAWDDPVTKHLPTFQMYDPWVTREIQIRDLLSHRAGLGLGQGDLLFWPDTNVSRAEVVNATRHLKPVSSMRTRYNYNNLMFVVAGEVVASVSGMSYDDFVRTRIFQPLGMNDTLLSATTFKPGMNIAAPHSKGWRFQGDLKPIHGTQDNTWAAAAGVKTNVTDLPKWVIAQLNRGKIDDTHRLFSESVSTDMWTPQISMRVSEPQNPALKGTKPNFSGYGLGWSLRDYRGRKIVSHGGALTGMLSAVQMVPDEKLGIIVLTNQEENGAISAIVYHILDSFFGVTTSTDYIAAYKENRDKTLQRQWAAEKKLDSERNSTSKPSLDLASYAGDYNDNWYGKATIAQENGHLVLHMTRTPAMVGDIQHWQYDTFKAVFRDPTIPDAFLTFSFDEEGKIIGMKMVPVSELADFSFDYQDLNFKPVPKTKEKAAGN